MGRKREEHPNEIPPELEHLYDPDEVFRTEATPEQVAEALFPKPRD